MIIIKPLGLYVEFHKFIFNVVRLLSLTFLLFLFVPLSKAQERIPQIDEINWGIPDQPFNCETNDSYLAKIGEMLKAQNNQNSLLIIIARLGDREKQPRLNYRRLYNVRLKLNKEFGIVEKKMVVAEGEEVKGHGRIEFYLSGEMIGTLLVEKNRDICVGCCDPDERFYPYKERLRKSKNKKSN